MRMVPLALPPMAPNASHREQKDADRADRQGERGDKGIALHPIDPSHRTTVALRGGAGLTCINEKARPVVRLGSGFF